MNSNVSFIVNGRMKKQAEFKTRFEEIFGQAGYVVSIFFTQGEGDGTRLAKAAAEEKGGFVIAVGGDGMMNEVVNGIMLAAQPEVIAGVLPHGTGNDFSRTVKIKDDPHTLLEMMQNREVRNIDIGQCYFTDPNGNPGTRYFNNITDIGLGGLAIQLLSQSSKKLGAGFAYNLAILRAFFKYKRKKIKLTAPDLEWEGELLSLVMANGKYFASGLCIAPDAELEDGLMQLVILGKVSIFDYLRELSNVKKGLRIKHPEVSYAEAPSLEVAGVGEELPIDMDGEYIGFTPLRVEILRGALPFLYVV